MKKTPLFESHKEAGSRFIPFAGWQMPFSYKSPTLEHLQVRNTGGLFDVSHMGQIRIKGKDSLVFLEKLLPSDLKSLKENQALYSVFCTETGGLIDDLILYCYSKENYLLCVNASAKDKDLNWIQSHKTKEDILIQDESADWSLIAVQGPYSVKLCSVVFPSIKFDKIARFHFLQERGYIFSRTGYTGEKGFEIYVPSKDVVALWNQFLKEGESFSISPVGLAARDTLRLEMAYLLSGQDFDETKSPLQAGLSWLLKNDENYIGKEAILRQKKEQHYSCLKAFVLEEAKAVPRKGTLVYSKNGKCVGKVTSGAKSPSLNQMIGLAYLTEATESFYDLDIRGIKLRAELVKTPFLKKKADF